MMGFLGLCQKAYCRDSGTDPSVMQTNDSNYSANINSSNLSLGFQQNINPFVNYLDSGLKYRGIKLYQNVYLSQNRLPGYKSEIALSIATGSILYKISTESLSVALLF